MLLISCQESHYYLEKSTDILTYMESFEVKEITAKSILSPSTLQQTDYDYSCNPYTGCRFSCVYCYASFMARMVGKKTEDWGSFVYAKMNAPDLLRTEINKLPNHGKGKVIWFSSVTDPYQGIETKYRLTRSCFEVLIQEEFEGKVSILTKSNLVVDDLEVFKKLQHVEVGLTITSTEDSISRYFEKFAPAASVRLDALRLLHRNSIPTYAFIGPILPHFSSKPEALDALFASVADTGVKEIYLEYLNLSPYIRKRLKNELQDLDVSLWDEFYNSQDIQYRNRMDVILKKLVQKYGFTLRLGSALYHKDMT